MQQEPIIPALARRKKRSTSRRGSDLLFQLLCWGEASALSCYAHTYVLKESKTVLFIARSFPSAEGLVKALRRRVCADHFGFKHSSLKNSGNRSVDGMRTAYTGCVLGQNRGKTPFRTVVASFHFYVAY